MTREQIIQRIRALSDDQFDKVWALLDADVNAAENFPDALRLMDRSKMSGRQLISLSATLARHVKR